MHITTTINEIQNRSRSYIYISRADQHYFPEPNEKFKLIDLINNKEYVVHLEKAHRIPGLNDFFKTHPEIKKGTKILIETIAQYKTYKIYIDHIPDELNRTVGQDLDTIGTENRTMDKGLDPTVSAAIQEYEHFRKLMSKEVSKMTNEELIFIIDFEKNLKAIHQSAGEKSDQRRPMSEIYFDSEGKEVTRANDQDFQTLSARHKNVIFNLPGFKDDRDLREWVMSGALHYDAGEYSKAHRYFSWSLRKFPILEPHIFYYVRVCENILSNPLTTDEIKYEASCERYRALPKLFRLMIMPKFDFRCRCKWCYRYTQYIHPNVPTFGHDTLANSCMSCGRMYPMPSWLWDSPDGRAYSYYRMSFDDDHFYDEFERDYDPKPLCQKKRKNKVSK